MSQQNDPGCSILILISGAVFAFTVLYLPTWFLYMASAMAFVAVTAFQVFGIILLGAICTAPIGLVVGLISDYRNSNDNNEADFGTGLRAWAIAIILWSGFQIPAHLLMSHWVLAEVANDFAAYAAQNACRADRQSMGARDRILKEWGYTMFGIGWRVSTNPMLGDSPYGGMCGVSTNSVYLFTWKGGRAPNAFNH